MIVTTSPETASATTADAFCLRARIPTVFMSYAVAHDPSFAVVRSGRTPKRLSSRSTTGGPDGDSRHRADSQEGVRIDGADPVRSEPRYDSQVHESPIGVYLDELDEPKQTTLRTLRATILKMLPEAEECIAYGAPAFKVGGKTIAGFAAYKNHLSYFPHSGNVLTVLAGDLSDHETSKGTLKFAIDVPLPESQVESS